MFRCNALILTNGPQPTILASSSAGLSLAAVDLGVAATVFVHGAPVEKASHPSPRFMQDAVAALRRSDRGDKALVSTIQSEAAKLDRHMGNLAELGPDQDRRPVDVGDVSIDLFNRVVRRNGREVHLTPKEYLVLAELAKHPGRVLTHGHLLRTAWGPAQESQTEYLRVAVRSLRQKLERDSSHPALIVNEPAVGYRLLAEAPRRELA